MSLAINSLCSIPEFRSFVSLKDDRQDVELESYIEGASDSIRQYVGFDPVSATYTEEKLSGDGTDYLMLKHRPITAVTEIQVEDEAIDITDLKYSGSALYLPGAFPLGFANIKVSYTAGYSDLPALFKTTALRISAFLYKERDGRIGISSVSDDGGSRTVYEKTVLNYLEELHPYRSINL
ncbi:MAG: hypothetical protein ACTSWQ_00935 [Candidatus Thorarchaeota archaeon]